MRGLVRFLEFAIVWGFLAVMARQAILALREPSMRRSYATMFASEGRDSLVEAALVGWRRKLGMSLWINLVAIPILLVGILVVVGELGDNIGMH